MAKKPTSPTHFEDALKELESLVARLEQGDLPLEESLKNFERGIELTRTCQQALQEAEQKVQTLVDKDGQPTLAPLDRED